MWFGTSQGTGGSNNDFPGPVLVEHFGLMTKTAQVFGRIRNAVWICTSVHVLIFVTYLGTILGYLWIFVRTCGPAPC